MAAKRVPPAFAECVTDLTEMRSRKPPLELVPLSAPVRLPPRSVYVRFESALRHDGDHASQSTHRSLVKAQDLLSVAGFELDTTGPGAAVS